MAYDKAKVTECGIMEGLSYFSKENRFKNEKELVDNFLKVIHDTIYKIYGYEIENIELEKTYNLKEYLLPSQRVDIYCTTKQGIDLFIECKNPVNINGELNMSIGQMLNYQMIIESIKRETKLILVTSLFSFYILKTIKRFSLNYDIILHNKNNSAFILSNEL